MRDYLRRTCDDIWVIGCSPEGHQPEVATRIFQGVQQPVCIVLASRSAKSRADTPATVRFLSLPEGKREAKFAALTKVALGGKSWVECPTDWRAPFLPASTGAWATQPALEDLFCYNGSGVMPGRTWIIAPDAESLQRRWQKLITAPAADKETLFHPHLRGGKVGDKHSGKIVPTPLAGYPPQMIAVADDKAACVPPTRYGFRSFDRQWIIPDSRVINQPNPELWAVRSERQVFLTALSRTSASSGPALTVAGGIPDLDHYNGRGGRIFPLWRDAEATVPNVRPALLRFLTEKYGKSVTAEDVVAYLAAVAAHPAFTARFQDDLTTPGLRIPLTAKPALFAEAVALGRTVIWLHTFGERMTDTNAGRLPEPPRLPAARRPRIPAGGAIPPDADTLAYDNTKQRLLIGTGFVENVPPAVWRYEVSGKQVLLQWFSYRKQNRERPLIGDRRPPSPLGNIQPDHWLAEYTTELINVLNVLGWLVELEPSQAALLEQLCAGPTITAEDLRAAGAFELPPKPKGKAKPENAPDLFGGAYQPHESPSPLRKPIPEQAQADAAHFYSAKEESRPYKSTS